ncbi:endonuclease/exonuclease/phosphatase family protein [Nocardioides xinjiangensis]|uniref:endonuclease/exonuclease/phosphatase family protein n=1 Tax=Nocardioides xinjiangensis TaxID=2817376 RepID=UPI001B3032E3|nr:endonuclease/exonuclease/phosphatase family protein [Nocardioides sp. SYSU D00514]
MTSRTRTTPAGRAALAATLAMSLAMSLVATITTASLAAAPPTSSVGDGDRHPAGRGHGAAPHDRAPVLRFATFNASLNRGTAGELVRDLSTPGHRQAAAAAETIQRTAPDVLLINEFDHDEAGRAAELFRDNYLAVGQNGAAPIDYPYYYVAPSNTGVPSGFDLNNDGQVGRPGTQAGGDDSLGFGLFPGQYGMVVYSRYPILTDEVRTFQRFLWKDMPGALLPDDPATPAPADWYSPDELDVLRLSSKSHWDVPVAVPGRKPVHFLVSHPTPPTFDGAEDRNGTRNHDEIRLWADYVSGGRRAAYIYDDAGRRGGLGKGQDFVIAGDQNADPFDGDSTGRAIHQLLDHPRIQDPRPRSTGAVEQSRSQAGANLTHTGPPAEDTADFADTTPGNLRADYVLPSRSLRVRGSGVYWLPSSDPLFPRLVGVYPFPVSDHRLVWVDVRASKGRHR